MEVRPFCVKNTTEIADLFYDAVHDIDSKIYTGVQKNVWASAPPDYARWAARLRKKKPFVALINEKVVGSMELDADGHIDCAYTHPAYQGIGVASALYKHLVQVAKAQNIRRLYVEASIVAVSFFEHRGFTIIKTNEVEHNGVELINFTMENHSPYKL